MITWFGRSVRLVGFFVVTRRAKQRKENRYSFDSRNSCSLAASSISNGCFRAADGHRKSHTHSIEANFSGRPAASTPTLMNAARPSSPRSGYVLRILDNDQGEKEMYVYEEHLVLSDFLCCFVLCLATCFCTCSTFEVCTHTDERNNHRDTAHYRILLWFWIIEEK